MLVSKRLHAATEIIWSFILFSLTIRICKQLWNWFAFYRSWLVRESSTIMAGGGGAGWNGGSKIFGENFGRGATQFLKIFKGGGHKTFWVILPQICMPIWWHAHAMWEGHEHFSHIWGWAAKLFYACEGECFTPPPTGCIVDNSLKHG